MATRHQQRTTGAGMFAVASQLTEFTSACCPRIVRVSDFASILEGPCEVVLVNAQHVKAVPGRKTDVKDAPWRGELLPHGLSHASFTPPKARRELRDLTRYRSALIQRWHDGWSGWVVGSTSNASLPQRRTRLRHDEPQRPPIALQVLSRTVPVASCPQ